MEFLQQVTDWHWFILAGVLFVSQVLLAKQFLFWLGFSAILVAVLYLLMPMSSLLQWVSFGIFSLFSTWLNWRYRYKKELA